MDFTFTEQQDMLRSAFHDFAVQEVKPHAAEWDEGDHCPTELFPILGELGVLGVFVPEQYGGLGLGHTERVMALEEIARYSAGLAMYVFTHQLGMGAILDFGSEEQKQKYLPKMCSGELTCGLAATEPSGGSDLAGIKTTAEATDTGWVLSGSKCFITNSHVTDVTVLTARTGQDDKGRPQLSAFIVEKGTPGFAPGRKENKLGLRGSVTGDLRLDKVAVTADQLCGTLHKGAAVAMKEIGEIGRASMSAICVGILRGCLEDGVKFSNERIVYGKPIAKLQAIQFHLAEIRLDYEAARLLLYSAVALKDAGQACTAEFAMAKHFGTEAACRSAKRLIELMGGYGVINEYAAGRYLRDALTSISSGGTSEIQRLIVAGDTLKKFSV